MNLNHLNVAEIKSKFMFAQSNAESSPGYTNLIHVAFLLKSCNIKKHSGKTSEGCFWYSLRPIVTSY